MKRFLVIISVLSAAAFSLPASAQHFDPEHRHSIEISTGIPPLQVGLFRPSDSVIIMNGISIKHLYEPSFNIAYTYAMSERWDLNVIINGCGAFMRRDHYPYTMATETYPDGTTYEYKVYDQNAEPVSSEKYYSGTMYTPMVNFRWKWLRRDNMRLYSSFGLGCLVLGYRLFIPTPYLTPIGINFGSGHFYGIAELNISCASTGALAGVGYRF